MAYGQVVADSVQTSSGAILGAGNATAFKNRLIDAGFIINQRGYTSGTSLSSGSYGHDRWKGGGSGGTYTFTQGSLGVPIVVTITAGSIQQVIEGCNVSEGGTYVLSWTGTAQGRFNGGSYGASPLAVTGVTAGANLTIEFNTGTLSYPQLEVGSTATSFDYRPYGTELQLCQRYYYKVNADTSSSFFSDGQCDQTTTAKGTVQFKVSMRTNPTALEQSGTATDYRVNHSATATTCSSVPTFGVASSNAGGVVFTVASGLTQGRACALQSASTTAYLAWSAEL